MTIPSPLQPSYLRLQVPLQPYILDALEHQPTPASPSPSPVQTDQATVPSLVQAHAPLEFEYATLRRSAGLIDMAHRATIEITGPERIDFLQRMLTQDLVGKRSPLPPLASRDSFWLNRKGRIDADIRLMLLPDRILVDVDIHAAERFITTLNAYLITEDCTLTDRTQDFHRLGLHGPASIAILAETGERIDGDPANADTVSRWNIAGAEVIVDRRDLTGEIGLELTIPADAVQTVHDALLKAGGWTGSDPFTSDHHLDEVPASSRIRPIGWHAFNIARIEAGTPLYYLDFGPENLPHESGVVESRIRFDKGCYLGQEIVARMQSLGHPKQRIVSLDLAPDATNATDPASVPQPMGGSPVLAEVNEAREVVGAVTSSTISPVLGARPICFAMVKWAFTETGTQVEVPAEGEILKATVRDRLRYWPA